MRSRSYDKINACYQIIALWQASFKDDEKKEFYIEFKNKISIDLPELVTFINFLEKNSNKIDKNNSYKENFKFLSKLFYTKAQ